MDFLRNLATVMVRPRATMRRILDAPRGGRVVLLLFALAAVSGIFGDFDAPMLQKVMDSRGPEVALLIAGAIIGVIALLVALMWFYAWVPYFAGKFLGGTGDIRGVRSALAWGLAPPIWALLYRVPAAFWVASNDASTTVRMREGTVNFDPGRIADGCGVALVVALIELVVFVWCACVMSNTVGEAQGFSAWHGLGTLVIAAIAPLVVMVAAFLAMT